MKTWYRSCGVCTESESDVEALEDFALRARAVGFYVLEKEVDKGWVEIATFSGDALTILRGGGGR